MMISDYRRRGEAGQRTDGACLNDLNILDCYKESAIFFWQKNAASDLIMIHDVNLQKLTHKKC